MTMSHLEKDNFSTYAYSAQRPFSASAFEDFAQSGIPSNIIRAKGLLWLDCVPRTVIFQMSGRRTNPFETVESQSPPCKSQLVLIGRNLEHKDVQEEIRAQLDALLAH